MKTPLGANNTFDIILSRQMAWAQVNGIPLNASWRSGYVHKLDHNLLEPVTDDFLKEFNTGGREVRSHMLALHSSSALAVNFFQRWRTRCLLEVLGDRLFSEPDIDTLQFEVPCPTGLGGMPPHLDVLLTGKGTRVKPIGIECKFTEPYTKAEKKPDISDSYFDAGLWEKMPKCYGLLQAIRQGEISFERLDAVQLLKHILGLQNSFGESGFRLVLLWYDFANGEARKMEEEIRTFILKTGGEIEFQAMTYQDAMSMLSENRNLMPDYFQYMEERYFDDDLTVRIKDMNRDVTFIKASVWGIKMEESDEAIVAAFDFYKGDRAEEDIPDLMMSLPKEEILKLKCSLEWVLRGMDAMEKTSRRSMP